MHAIEGQDILPRPRISPDNKPFWDGVEAGHLRLPSCTSCGKPHLPPGPVCPFCFSPELEWIEASGKGTISTWTIVHKVWFPVFADRVPYNVIQVELDEGPRLTARLVENDGPPRVGQRVSILFERIEEGLTLPAFRPIPE